MTPVQAAEWAYLAGMEAGRAAVLAEQAEAERAKAEKMKLSAEHFAAALFKNCNREGTSDDKR